MADNQTLKEYEDSLKSIKQAQKEIEKDFGSGLVFSLQKAILEADRLTEKFKKGQDATKDLDKTVNRLLNTQITLNSKSLKLEKDLEKAIKTGNGYRQESIKSQIKSVEAQKKLTESLLTQVDIAKDINEKEEKKNQILESILGKQANSIKQLLTLSGIFGIIVSKALEFNKFSVENGRLLAYGADRANELQQNFVSIARSSTDANITSKSLNEAFSQLVAATGYVGQFTADTLKTQILLTKQFGLTAEEASRIYEFSVLTGESSSKVNDEMVGAFVAARNQLKVGIPFKTAIAAAAQVSGQLAANLQNNPALITKAVVQASALGTTLQQTASQAEKLLDFSSSIENELKAELLVGKQLNLERARAAALAGDQVTAAQELFKNVGSIEEFQRMNVLEQKALAEAVGLTSDQLADQLRKQKIAEETGKSLAQITKEEALEAQKRQDIQTRFNNSIEKLQDLLGGIAAGPLGAILDMFSSLLNNSIALSAVLGGALVANLLKVVSAIRTAKKLSLSAAVVEIIKSAYQSLGGLPGVGLILAGAGAAAGVAYLMSESSKAESMADGIIGPGGETIVSGPKGSIKLDKNDSLVAGTNLFDNGNNNTMSSMVSAINEVRDAVNRLYNKDTSINMDGKKVGTTLTQGSYKVA